MAQDTVKALGLSFNEFQRELQKRNFPPEHIHMYTFVYERMVQMAQGLDEVVALMTEMADSLQGFVNLREEDQRKFEEIGRKIGGFGRTPGVDVSSESMGDDPKKKN